MVGRPQPNSGKPRPFHFAPSVDRIKLTYLIHDDLTPIKCPQPKVSSRQILWLYSTSHTQGVSQP